MTEFDYLIGGKITAVKQEPDEEMGRDLMTTLTVTFPRPKRITTMGDTFVAKSVDMEVWMDPEGNGPGELVLVSAIEMVKA